MKTLHVKFPGNWPGWHIPECTLNCVEIPPTSDSAANAVTVSVDSETHSDYSSDSPVFRASLVDSSTRITVALKFAMREDLIPDLAEEACVYTGALESLQGTTIPRCYGLYQGFSEDGQPMACLVLEYWGECLRKPFQHLPLHLKMRILERLGEIHQHGLLHGDFAERNVLELDGDIRIIDFDQTKDHACKCDMNFSPGEKLPDAEGFGCKQLWEICHSEMRIWDSASLGQ